MEVDGEEAPLHEIRLDRLAPADRDVRLAHPDVELVVVEDQLQLHVGVELDEVLHPCGEPGGAEPDGGGDAQDAARPVARIDQCAGHGLKLAGDPGRGLEQLLALLGEEQAACVAVEERDADLHLQRVNLTAHRGLADAQLLASVRETALLRGCMKHPQLVPVHGNLRRPVRPGLNVNRAA